jgi:hypothetical protein
MHNAHPIAALIIGKNRDLWRQFHRGPIHFGPNILQTAEQIDFYGMIVTKRAWRHIHNESGIGRMAGMRRRQPINLIYEYPVRPNRPR